MGEINYERLYKTAVAYGKKRGLNDDAEDFAQECLIKAYEVGAINLEYIYLNYTQYQRADKRILSGPCGALSGFRTVSLDAPVDSSNEDSGRLSDLIGDTRNELGDGQDLNDLVSLYRSIARLARTETARKWAIMIYEEWLKEQI